MPVEKPSETASEQARELLKLASTPDQLGALKERIQKMQGKDILSVAQAMTTQVDEIPNTLKEMLREQAATDASLTNLEARLQMARLLGATSGGGTIIETAAPRFRFLGGRRINEILAFFEKNPALTNMATSSIAGFGISNILSIIGLNFGARPRLLDLDMMESIQAFEGEQIKFENTSASSFEAFVKKQQADGKPIDIKALTQKYVSLQRRLHPGEAVIEVSLAKVLEETPKLEQARIQARGEEVQTSILSQWQKKIDGVREIQFGSPTSFEKAKGAIVVAESDLKNGVPQADTAAKTLQEAIGVLTVDKIVIGDAISFTWEAGRSIATLPQKLPKNFEIMKDLAKRKPSRITEISIGGDAVGPNTLVYDYKNKVGTLEAPNDHVTLAALANKPDLPFPDAFSESEHLTWKLINGSFELQQPIEIKPIS